MESKHQTPSVMLKLMGLDKVPTQHPVGDKPKVLSENYLQKVASIGVRKKRSSRQDCCFAMDTDEKEESEDALKVVKAIRRDKDHNPSKGNRKENLFSSGTKGETFELSKSQLDLKDEVFNSRIAVLMAKPLKGGNSLKYLSFRSSWKNSHLADELLTEIFYPKSMRVYPEMRDRKKTSYHMNFGKQRSPSYSKTSEEVSMLEGNVANRILDTDSSSFFRGKEAFANDMLKPTSNVSVNEIQCNSPIFCSDGSYVSSAARNKTLEQRDVTEKFQDLEQRGQESIHNQLPMISEHGNGARNLSHQSGYHNDKIKRNIRSKVGVNSFTGKAPRPIFAASVMADNCGTLNNDNLFQKYWGLRKNASANWSTWKLKKQNIYQKNCSEDVNLNLGSEKFPSFNSNHTEENKCYRNDFSDKKTMPPQLSSSSPSPTLIDSQILLEKCLMNDELKDKNHEDRLMSKQNVVSTDSSVDCLVSDAATEVVGWSHDYPTKQQSKSTAFNLLEGDIDSLNHTSYASKQQDTSDFQEDSVHSLCSEADSDSLGRFEEAYGPSPISVLDSSFSEDILFSSKFGIGVYDSSEADDEEFGLNVSSDDDCGNESVGDSEEEKDMSGLFRAEESRDFSYVVEVLTEAGISNRSLFTDFSTWHSAECPISPSVFEILEKKFGEQQLWKRSERRLLFDRINFGLLEILQPYLYVPMWEKSVSRRLNAEPSQDMIEEEMWGLLVAQEKKASKESADNMLGGEIRWIEIGEDIEDIIREIVKLLIEELANEIVSLEKF